jgi:replicative DNA helicase
MSDPTSNATENAQSEPARLLRLSQVLGDALADARAAYDARVSGRQRGPISGLPSLDREIAQAFAPGVHGVHGNAGAGKTAFALQVAASCGFPCLYVTCEMAPAELLRRHAARATGTYLNRFKSGEMPPAEVERLYLQACEAAPDLAFLDATRTGAMAGHIIKCAQATQGSAHQVLVIVDSLQSWAEGERDAAAEASRGAIAGSEYESLNSAVKALRNVAHALKCPVLFISERNRDSMKSGGLNAGAGTRKIEYGTETVIDLDRDLDEEADGAGEVPITLRLSKNRHGAAGKKIPVVFHGALQRFREDAGRPSTPASSGYKGGTSKATSRRLV